MIGARVLAVVGVLVLGGCGTATGPAEPDPPPPELQPQTSLPAADVTVLAGDDPVDLALRASQALFDHSPVVVLADAADQPGIEAAADQATELGVPVLLIPDDAESGLQAELDRLGVVTVLAQGGPAAGWARQLDLAVAPTGAPAPPVAPAAPLTSFTVLTRDEPYHLAPAATARAAGARVLETAATDPRTDPDLVAALGAEPAPSHTLALGEFGPADRLRDRLAVAATGVQLPGGGQVLFPGRRLVALYGHPGTAGLGVLGEQPLDQTLARAAEVAAEYESVVAEPVVPALEIITTIASAGPGPAGDYSRRTPIGTIREWVDAAAAAGSYVVLDLQPGHTDFLTQAKEYEEVLVEPHVGLALDPEWRLAPDQQHMVNIGQVDAAEVNQVIEWLADLTAAHRLPQKLLILHQFQLRMITHRDEVDTSRDELAVLIHADGFGTQAQKLATWDALHVDPPDRVWWGWKNFYDEDRPTFTPAQTADVTPSPVFISYQ